MAGRVNPRRGGAGKRGWHSSETKKYPLKKAPRLKGCRIPLPAFSWMRLGLEEPFLWWRGGVGVVVTERQRPPPPVKRFGPAPAKKSPLCSVTAMESGRPRAGGRVQQRAQHRLFGVSRAHRQPEESELPGDAQQRSQAWEGGEGARCAGPTLKGWNGGVEWGGHFASGSRLDSTRRKRRIRFHRFIDPMLH